MKNLAIQYGEKIAPIVGFTALSDGGIRIEVRKCIFAGKVSLFIRFVDNITATLKLESAQSFVDNLQKVIDSIKE